MLIKLTLKSVDATYIEDVPGDTKAVVLRKIASEKFRIPEAGIKMTVNGQPLKMDESVASQLLERDSIMIEMDQENFESNENQMRVQVLQEKLSQSHDVLSLLTFYKQNEKLIQPFLLSAQDKLRKSIKIIKFVDELKKTEVVDRAEVQRQVEAGADEYTATADQLFPHSYLSYNQGYVDGYLVVRQKVQEAKVVIKDQQGNMPVALQDEAPLRAKNVRGPESDFYELTELENQNITSVLVENLFTEIAVMSIIWGEEVKNQEKMKDQFKNYRQKDQFEDMKEMYMLSVYNLMELIDIKDLLLGQYVDRKKKFSAESAKQGYLAYITKLRNIYKDELDMIIQSGVSRDKEAEVLQRLEQTNGNVQKVLEEFL